MESQPQNKPAKKTLQDLSSQKDRMGQEDSVDREASAGGHCPIININNLNYARQAHGDNYEAHMAPVASQLGAEKLGCRVVKVPSGKKAWPYHAHYVNDEMFYILAGRGTYRYKDDNHPVKAGDFIAAPAGIDHAHQLINDSDAELVYIAWSTMEEPEFCVYPDSSKFGFMAGSAPGASKDTRLISYFGKEESAIDYWQDEE